MLSSLERFVFFCIISLIVFIVGLVFQERTAKKALIFKKAEKYVKEYRQKERDIIRLKRQAKEHGNFYVPAESKLAFVVRIRG